MICLGRQAIPVNRIVLFHVISYYDYVLQLKKLNLYTKLGPDTVHKTPISFHIKFYLLPLVYYQHLQKYFYNWNISGVTLYIWNCTWQHQIPILRHHYFAHFVNDSKSYVPAVPLIMSFKVLKDFSSGKISLFLFASL